MRAYGKFNVANSLTNAVKDCDAVVGCTGQCRWRGQDINALKDGAILFSMSSEREEFPIDLLEDLSSETASFAPDLLGTVVGTVYTFAHTRKRVIVLNNGEPINFSEIAPTEAAVFDLVMAAFMAGALELMLGNYADRSGLLDVFDGVVERHRLCEIFLATHPLEAA